MRTLGASDAACWTHAKSLQHRELVLLILPFGSNDDSHRRRLDRPKVLRSENLLLGFEMSSNLIATLVQKGDGFGDSGLNVIQGINIGFRQGLLGRKILENGAKHQTCGSQRTGDVMKKFSLFAHMYRDEIK